MFRAVLLICFSAFAVAASVQHGSARQSYPLLCRGGGGMLSHPLIFYDVIPIRYGSTLNWMRCYR